MKKKMSYICVWPTGTENTCLLSDSCIWVAFQEVVYFGVKLQPYEKIKQGQTDLKMLEVQPQTPACIWESFQTIIKMGGFTF